MNEQTRKRAAIVRRTLAEIEKMDSNLVRIPVASVEWAQRLERILANRLPAEWDVTREGDTITLTRAPKRIVLLH